MSLKNLDPMQQKLTINMVTSASTALLNGIPHVAGEAASMAMLSQPSVMSLSAMSHVKRRKTAGSSLSSSATPKKGYRGKIEKVVTDEAEQTAEIRRQKMRTQLEKQLKNVSKLLKDFENGDAISTPTLNHTRQLLDMQSLLKNKIQLLDHLEETDASCIKYEEKDAQETIPIEEVKKTLTTRTVKRRFNEDDEVDEIIDDEEGFGGSSASAGSNSGVSGTKNESTPFWMSDAMFTPPTQVKLLKRTPETLKTQDNLSLFKNVSPGFNKVLIGQPTDYDRYVELAMASGDLTPKVHVDQGICLQCYSTMFIGESDSSIVCYQCGSTRRFDDMALPDTVPGGFVPTMTRSAGWKAHHVTVQGASGATTLINTNLPNSQKPVKSGPAARAAFSVTFELPPRPLLADENGKPLLSAASSELIKQKQLAESEKKKPGRRKKQPSDVEETKKTNVQKRTVDSDKNKLFPFGDLDFGVAPQSQQIVSSMSESSSGNLLVYPQLESMMRLFKPRQHQKLAPEIYDKLRLDAFRSRKSHFEEDDIKRAIRSMYYAPVTSKNPTSGMTEEEMDAFLMNVPYSKSDGLSTMAVPMKIVQQLFEEFQNVVLPVLTEQEMSKIRTHFHDAVEAAKKLGFLSLLRAQFLFVRVCSRLGFESIAKFHDSIRPGNPAYDGLMVCWNRICKLLNW